MRPERFGSRCSTSEKVELVLQLLAGKTLAELSEETGRPRKQLSAWRRRFLAGGEAYLDGDREQSDTNADHGAEAELEAKLAALEAKNGMLSRQIALLGDRTRRAAPHPYCSEAYALALEEPGVERFHVPSWGTYVLVREGQTGVRHAAGARPFGSLDPSSNPEAGLKTLREAGIASFSIITDPMWGPDPSTLRTGFDICRSFKEYYVVDREVGVQIRKRHRNRINQARRGGEVHEVSLANHLDRWLELYQSNVDNRRIPQPFTPGYFKRLTTFEGLRTVAIVANDEIVMMSLWIPHQDTLYFHDGASSLAGMEISAAYAAFAHVIETAAEARYVLLGGSAGLRDERSDGLATFKRGFANGSVVSYLCSSSLSGEN